MSIIRTSCQLLALCFFVSTAFAGKNAGGALVVHTDDTITYRWFGGPDFCEPYEEIDPETCEALNAQSNFHDPGYLTGSVIWFLAAFPEGSAPGVSGVTFGIEHSLTEPYIGGWNFCGPLNSLESPDPGWPGDWAHAGNVISFGSPVVDDLLFPIYWFGIYADPGDFMEITPHPNLSEATFLSDDDPGVIDEITRFGQIRWFEPGFNECPEAPTSSVEDSPPLTVVSSWGSVRASYR